MEIIVRMRRYMEEKKVKYRSIHDPLCWTEAQIVTNFISQKQMDEEELSNIKKT
jgi:hypothetical protein